MSRQEAKEEEEKAGCSGKEAAEEEEKERIEDESERGEEDYIELKDLRLDISKLLNRDNNGDGGVAKKDRSSFTLCLWIYLLNSTQYPSSIINQVSSDGDASVSFLELNEERKITLMPLVLTHKEASLDEAERPFVSAELECPFEKWVHVACEVGRLCSLWRMFC